MNKCQYFTIFSLLLFMMPIKSVMAEEFKLSNNIIPTSQIIKLMLDPESGKYSGETTITINITKPSTEIKLYSKNLLINSALIKSKKNKETLTLVNTNKYDITSFSAKNTLLTGKHQLLLSFEGKYTNTGDGLFKVIENNENYLFTQFQSMLTRTVFPSFDQPNFKIPFQFHIRVPTGYLAISNTPQMKLSSHDGWDTYIFEPTAPIYTDILSFAVGKFDSINIPNMPIPSKIYVVKGKLADTTYVKKHIGNIFEKVETFFSTQYPYKKLDIIAVPNFSSGAMENAGLIYFKEDFLLLGEVPTISQQKYSLKLIAHEISHMWFGNLVTMQWWNDLWLNESFAEWLARKIVTTNYPELSAELDLPQIRSLFDDNVDTQLPIRRNVKSKTDADSMGGIVYDKGNAVLNMVELYVGEDIFRQAVIAYISEYKNGNATLQNFVKHIELASHKNLTNFFSSFLEQPGFPLLSLKVNDDKLLISQQPFSANNNDKVKMLWHIPVILKFLTDEGIITKSIFLNQQTTAISLPKNVNAIFPDAKAVGYYRYVIPNKDENFIKNNIFMLNNKEKLAWIDNNTHLINIAKRAYVDVLSIKIALLSDSSLNKKIATDIIRDIDFSYTDFIPVELQEKYSLYIAKQLQKRLKAVEWHSNSNSNSKNTIADESLNAALLNLAGSRLRNKKAINFAKENYQAVLFEKSSLDSSMSKAVLEVVAANSTEVEYLLFEKAYLKTKNSNLKSNILTAMGYFSSPDIVNRYYDFLLSGKVPIDDISYRFQYPSFNPNLRLHVLNYIDNNKGKILQRINQKQWFPYNFYTSCEENIRTRVNQVFSSWVVEIPGLKEKLNIVDKTIKQCINSRAQNIVQLQKQLLK